MVTDSNIIYYYMLFTQQKYGKKGKGTKINHSISIPFAFHFKWYSGRCRWNGVFLRLNVNVWKKGGLEPIVIKNLEVVDIDIFHDAAEDGMGGVGKGGGKAISTQEDKIGVDKVLHEGQ